MWSVIIFFLGLFPSIWAFSLSLSQLMSMTLLITLPFGLELTSLPTAALYCLFALVPGLFSPHLDLGGWSRKVGHSIGPRRVDVEGILRLEDYWTLPGVSILEETYL